MSGIFSWREERKIQTRLDTGLEICSQYHLELVSRSMKVSRTSFKGNVKRTAQMPPQVTLGGGSAQTWKTTHNQSKPGNADTTELRELGRLPRPWQGSQDPLGFSVSATCQHRHLLCSRCWTDGPSRCDRFHREKAFAVCVVFWKSESKKENTDLTLQL